MDPPPVQYVTTSDGYNIAYAVIGDGRPLVLMPDPFSHIEIYWSAGIALTDWYQGLAAKFRFVQYDGRGQGMSSRELRPGHKLSDEVGDLELLVDRLQLDDFVLVSRSHASVHYCLRHPERVRALVLAMMPLYGSSWPSVWMSDLAAQDWDLFLSTVAGINTRAVAGEAIERLRQSSTQQDYVARMNAFAESEVADLLPGLRTPTLVLAGQDQRIPAKTESQEFAARIPNARLVLVDGTFAMANAPQGIDAIESFLAGLDLSVPEPAGAAALKAAAMTPRETEVLRLVSAGKTNQQIANDLVISLNTVTNHVKNILNKTGSANRTEAANYAHRHHLV